ncbi:MAG: DUF116 domain-containing protein [Nitrospirae bacterium]|nr:DUF116 domain-containing protein [Nitrospirota bacterium]
MWAKWIRGVVLKIYYPILMLLGAFFKDKKEGFQRHIINLNNRLVLRQGIKTQKILLMLPHCLQVDKCDIRITNNIYNCKRCGRCGVKDLINVSEDKKLELYMATGGSVARKIVMEVRPQAIVAVACERDLSSGIVDSYPLPVIGIHNERPFGPCVNTCVSIEKVQAAINSLCP